MYRSAKRSSSTSSGSAIVMRAGVLDKKGYSLIELQMTASRARSQAREEPERELTAMICDEKASISEYSIE